MTLRRRHAPLPAVCVMVAAAVPTPLHELRTAGACARPVQSIFLEHGAGLPSLHERARLFWHSEILREWRSFPTLPRQPSGGRALRQKASLDAPSMIAGRTSAAGTTCRSRRLPRTARRSRARIPKVRHDDHALPLTASSGGQAAVCPDRWHCVCSLVSRRGNRTGAAHASERVALYVRRADTADSASPPLTGADVKAATSLRNFGPIVCREVMTPADHLALRSDLRDRAIRAQEQRWQAHEIDAWARNVRHALVMKRAVERRRPRARPLPARGMSLFRAC
jgi:hypothetical protein